MASAQLGSIVRRRNLKAIAERIRYGYWTSRQLNGEIPAPVQSPSDYNGGEVLNVACTQTGLPRGQQKRLVDEWIERLTRVPATTIVFSSKVSQELFAAACAAPHLEALNVKWSSITSLEPLGQCQSLKAFFLGSSPSIEDLVPLSQLSELRWLFVENVAAPVDLSFVDGLGELREFGISASRGKKLSVKSLVPLASLKRLEMLWLVSIRMEEGGLKPLERLDRLESFRSTVRKNSREFKDLCAALPSLKYFQPVG